MVRINNTVALITAALMLACAGLISDAVVLLPGRWKFVHGGNNSHHHHHHHHRYNSASHARQSRRPRTSFDTPSDASLDHGAVKSDEYESLRAALRRGLLMDHRMDSSNSNRDSQSNWSPSSLSPTQTSPRNNRAPPLATFLPLTTLTRDGMLHVFEYIGNHQPPSMNARLISDDVSDLDFKLPRALERQMAHRLRLFTGDNDVDVLWVPSTLWDLYVLANPVDEVHSQRPPAFVEGAMRESMPDEYAPFLRWLDEWERGLVASLHPEHYDVAEAESENTEQQQKPALTSRAFVTAVERLLVQLLDERPAENGDGDEEWPPISRHWFLENDGLRRREFLAEELNRVRECRKAWLNDDENDLTRDRRPLGSDDPDYIPPSRRASMDQSSLLMTATAMEQHLHCASLLLRAIDVELEAREQNEVPLFSDSADVALRRVEYDQLRASAKFSKVSRAPKVDIIYEESLDPNKKRVMLVNPVDARGLSTVPVHFSYSLLAGFLYDAHPRTGDCVFTRVYRRLMPTAGDRVHRDAYTFASLLSPGFLRGSGRQFFFLPPVQPHRYIYHYHRFEFPQSKTFMDNGLDPMPNEPLRVPVVLDFRTTRQYYNDLSNTSTQAIPDPTFWRHFLPQALVREIYTVEDGQLTQKLLSRGERTLVCARFALALSAVLRERVLWLASRHHVQFP